MKLRLIGFFLLGCLGFTVASLGLPANSTDDEFYDTNLNLVGEYIKLCSGATYSWGVRTEYVFMDSESCSTGARSCAGMVAFVNGQGPYCVSASVCNIANCT